MIVWDGLRVHHSRAVRAFAASQAGWIGLQFLPAYAPELNPTEYIWGHLKQHEIPKLLPAQLEPAEPHCDPLPPPHAPAPRIDHRLLEASGPLRYFTIICETQ